jgi:hypothetical protein
MVSSMNILCSKCLVIHLHNIPMVSGSITFLVLIVILEGGQIGGVSLGCPLDSWQLFHFLLVLAVHRQSIVDTSHVLRGPKVLKNVLHILTVGAHVWR